MTRIIALISTYREDELLRSCINSARDCDFTIIFDGPTTVENAENAYGRNTTPYSSSKIRSYVGEWDSDATKRTAMLELAKTAVFQAWGANSSEEHADIWGLWLDGDEILLWGQYLHDHCQRAEQETATGGTTLRIVEYDGSVAECYGKLIKLSTVKRYVMSSYEVELENGMTVALPNVPICTAGGIPYVKDRISSPDDPRLGYLRPPLQGEPHLLHRHGLRSKNRGVARMHDAESDSFSSLVKDAGLQGVDQQTAEERIGNG